MPEAACVRLSSRLSVVLAERATVPLAWLARGDEPVLELGLRHLDVSAIRRWLMRMNVQELPAGQHAAAGSDDPSALPLVRLPTLVLCVDPRAEPLARMYAQAVGAPFARGLLREEAMAALGDSVDEQTVTVFALADMLDEGLCDMLWSANQLRRQCGSPTLPCGLMVGVQPEHLAWLVLKTLVVLTRESLPDRLGVLAYDGFASRLGFREVSRRDGVGTPTAAPIAPWTADCVHVVSAFTHGVSFDASLGDTVLCGRTDALPAMDGTGRFPSCVVDGKCFRLAHDGTGPHTRLVATQASALCWFLNSCGAIALAGHAFGVASSYAAGLLCGAAVSVIGSYIVQVSSVSRSAVFESLLCTGLPTGRIAEALSSLVPDCGYDSYILMGSPDVNYFPDRAISATHGSDPHRFQIQVPPGASLRLRMPAPARSESRPMADDGDAVWSLATYQAVQSAGELDLLVFPPSDAGIDSWLAIDCNGRGYGEIVVDVRALERNVSTLRLFQFAADKAEDLTACASLIATLSQCLSASKFVRQAQWIAACCAQLEMSLSQLQVSLVRCFLEQMADGDFNFDREGYNGFIAEPPQRSTQRCPGCRSSLFVSVERRENDRDLIRHKAICAHCLGVSLVPAANLVDFHVREHRRDSAGKWIDLSLLLHNVSERDIELCIGAACRKGGRGGEFGPAVVPLAAGERCEHIARVSVAQALPGVKSIRLIALARGSVQFHSVLIHGDEVPIRAERTSIRPAA